MIIKMVSSCCLVTALALSASGVLADVKLKGVSVPEEVTFSGHTMVLNGVGVRSRFFVDAYVAALYLPKKKK